MNLLVSIFLFLTSTASLAYEVPESLIFLPKSQRSTFSADGKITLADVISVRQSTYGRLTVTSVLTLGNGSATAPSLAFLGASSNTGFYRPAEDELSFTANGTRIVNFTASGISGATTGSWFGKDGTASLTVPTLIPHKSDDNTGLGANNAGDLALIVDGTTVLNAMTEMRVAIGDGDVTADATLEVTPEATETYVVLFSSANGSTNLYALDAVNLEH